MPPRRTPEEVMQEGIAQMAQVMTGMTQVMAQLVNVNAAREAAAAERQAAEDEHQAQRLAREGAMKNKRRSKPSSGGPDRSYQTQGRQAPYKPYQQDKGKGKAAGQGSHQGRAPRISEAAKEGVCFRCGEPGHYANQCGAEKLCYHCNKPGHLARDCRAPKAEPTTNMARGGRPIAQARVYTMSGEQAAGADGLIQGQGVWLVTFVCCLIWARHILLSLWGV